MSRSTTLLGTACVLAAALAAGPAAADTLMNMQGIVDSTYTHFTPSCSGCDGWNTADLGGSAALPLADLQNLNWQLDAHYQHGWGGGDSAETWNFGFSPFWAGPQSRFGINFNYDTETHSGHFTTGGIFGEWYLNDALTIDAKFGYESAGGTPIAGNGAYIAGGATFYAFPDLAINGHIGWIDETSSGSSISGPVGFCGSLCRMDVNSVTYAIEAEFMPNEMWGASVYGGFAYENESFAKFESHDTVWHIGLRWYTGGGSLEDRHRNGTLHKLNGPN